MLDIRGVCRGGLSPINLVVERGDCVAIMGPSGAGKTLLLRAIADLDPNAGDVALNGVTRSAMSGPAWRRKVLYVPAESGWWTDIVGDHMQDHDVATAIAMRLNLPADVLAWPVARLSTGERQRLAMVRALGLNPPVLLLDEPTAALDPDSAAAVEAVIGERRAGGVAIILVTHDRAQAERLAGRILTMHAGRLYDGADSAP